MKIVKLTNANNNTSLYLNIDHIVDFSAEENNAQRTYIELITGDSYLVNENINDVLFLVSE